MAIILSGIYLGKIKTLEPEGQSTGIYKFLTNQRINVTRFGLVGDVQVDKRVHGGIDKALHQYAIDNYGRLATAFPEIKEQLIAGSLGENLTSSQLNETNVHIGDIYQFGNIKVQVSEPRSPCWKINHKFNTQKLSAYIDENGLTGWYYRVISEGDLAIGDEIKLLQRPNPDWNLVRFWQVHRNHRPNLTELEQAISLNGLSLPWQQKLQERFKWLNDNQSK